jgi:anion-transporting  ArsA/GET3 family ATPase
VAFTPLGSRKLLFVTGKGGVGKTTIAAGLARALADEGKSVLLVALDMRSEVGEAFGLTRLSFEPTKVDDHLSVMVLDTEAALQEYLKINLRVPIVAKLSVLANALDFLANAAPGVRELLTIGKLCYEVREKHYDVIVADSPATGHIVGYLAAPEAINSFVRVGLIRNQTDWMVDILHDPAQTGVVAVTTPEEMPILETKQLLATLAAETKVAVAAAIMNRVPDIVAHGATLGAIDAIIDQRPGIFATETLQGIVTANQLAVARRREAELQFGALRDVVGLAFPIITQPNIAIVPEGSTMAREVANSLSEEIA